MQQLNGQVALITGGGRGLGAAICRVLSRAGAVIACGDIREDLAASVAEDLNNAGCKCLSLRLDVADEDSVERGVKIVLAQFGKIDILVNNAGVDVTLPVEEMTVKQWNTIIDVNLRGPFLLSKYVYTLMKERKSGHIVSIASTAAKRAWANASAYHASKWGLLGLTNALHVEARQHNVKVTAVVCGGMKTQFLLDRFPDIDTATLQDPENVAETIRFILTQPQGTVIPEVMVLPLLETSWP